MVADILKPPQLKRKKSPIHLNPNHISVMITRLLIARESSFLNYNRLCLIICRGGRVTCLVTLAILYGSQTQPHVRLNTKLVSVLSAGLYIVTVRPKTPRILQVQQID